MKFDDFTDWYNRYPMFVASWTVILCSVFMLFSDPGPHESYTAAVFSAVGFMGAWLREVNLRLMKEPFGGRLSEPH